jgi:hypothetical protein
MPVTSRCGRGSACQSGAPVAVVNRIGITLDLYSHVTATMQAVAAEAMGRLLGGQDDSKATDDGGGVAS